MNLHTLTKTTTKANKRLGRGGGSGKGFHTASRGQKGQKSRSSVSLWFEGGQLPMSRRLPFIRGKDRFKTLSDETVTINLSRLAKLPKDTVVDRKLLVEVGLVSAKEAANQPIKILSQGQISQPLVISGLKISQAAADKIVKAGGRVEAEA